MKVIKILALQANPTDTKALRLGAEIRGIEEALKQTAYGKQFTLINKGAVRVADLLNAMSDYEPDIVHFAGHGTGVNGLVLEKDAGAMQLVPTEALRLLFEQYKRTTKCVFLNACHSKVQVEAIYPYVDCVIGMNKVVNDQAAIKFAARFYQGLATGKSYQSAFNDATLELALLGDKDASTPELLNRTEGADPLKLLAAPETQQPSQDPKPSGESSARRSLKVGNITNSGSGNFVGAMQAGGDISVNQSSQPTSSNPDLQAALAALEKLKQAVAAEGALNPLVKAGTESTLEKIQKELNKPKPNKSLVDEAVDALKQGLNGVLTLAEPVTKVAELLAKAWVGLL